MDQPSERYYNGPVIESWIENVETPDEFHGYDIELFNYYEQTTETGEQQQMYYYLTGGHTDDGVLTVGGGFDGMQMVTLSPGDIISADSGMYLDDQGWFSMTEAAYEALNAFIADADREDWQAFALFEHTRDMYRNNFSVDHPFGVRGSDGVFRFAGSNDYRYGNGPMRLLDGPGGEPIQKGDFPVFPDPTLGGVLPGMTQARLESFVE